MSDFPSNKTYILTFATLIVYLCLDFYFKGSKDFFQLNYNWSEAKVLKSFDNVEVDSIAYDFIQIKTTPFVEASDLSPENTFCFNDAYYFRSKNIVELEEKIIFNGGFWVNTKPEQLSRVNLKEVDLQLIQNGTTAVCMIGDSQLTYKTGKFTRKNIFLKLNDLKFVGTDKDLYGFPYSASTLNNSSKILKTGLDKIPMANVYIIFLGAHEESLNAINKNFNDIISQLSKRKQKLILVVPPNYTNPNKKGISPFIRNLYFDYQNSSNVEIIDLISIMGNPELYLQPDGIHLNSNGHQLLTNLLIKQLKHNDN